MGCYDARSMDGIVGYILKRLGVITKTKYKCDICGAETDNAFISSGKWKRYSVCDKCAQIKGDELSRLAKNKQFAIMAAKILADDTDDD